MASLEFDETFENFIGKQKQFGLKYFVLIENDGKQVDCVQEM